MIYLTSHFNITFIVVPNFWHPIHTCTMGPSNICFCYNSLKILTKNTFSLIWIQTCFLQMLTSITKPVFVQIWQILRKLSSIAWLMSCRIAAITNKNWIIIFVVFIQANVTRNIFINIIFRIPNIFKNLKSRLGVNWT